MFIAKNCMAGFYGPCLIYTSQMPLIWKSMEPGKGAKCEWAIFTNLGLALDGYRMPENGNVGHHTLST